MFSISWAFFLCVGRKRDRIDCLSVPEKIPSICIIAVPTLFAFYGGAFLSLTESVYWNLIILVSLRHLFTGLSSFLPEKSNKMLRKNQYLLLPHVPNRDNSKIDSSNSTVSNNETSETSDLSVDAQGTVNHNFLMENHNNENHIAMINENDENYFEIFKTPMKFGTENNTEVTAQIGTTALLPCTIHSVGEGVVSNFPLEQTQTLTWQPFIKSNLFSAQNDKFEAKIIITRFPLQVSWIRRKDYHLLTVGLTTYSSDERFSAAHLKNSEVCLLWPQVSLKCHDNKKKYQFQDWTLQIKYVQMRDAGTFECQVSKHPPISIFVILNVVGKQWISNR